MKYLLVLSFLILSGCQTTGRFFKGFGDGYQASQANQQKPVYCTGEKHGTQVSAICQ